uniref:Prefoldin subunit 1 n=1 Tax=Caligus rogercresseyi TaxID=217165 RepID=C1BNZ7_CALRO|nr:Prefoldin subunit 1 [Caligus rogercresseyi]ACO11274.1 Prefoldin subunit 1 [Caligus rogercresseyi]
MTAGVKGPDLELKKAFSEMQSKMMETKQKMKVSDVQIENLKRSITHAELTDAEISGLSDDIRIYESLGRMFMLSTKGDVKKDLEDRRKKAADKIKVLEGNQEYLERNLKENENSLRELVLQKRSQS